MTFEEWSYKWLEVYKKDNIKEKTYGIYRYILEKHICPSIGLLKMDKITSEDILILIHEQKQTGNLNGGSLANNSINLIITVLKGLFNDALDAEVIMKNPMRRIKKMKKEEKKVKSFSVKDQQKIEKYCLTKGSAQAIGIIVCLYTGLRIGELLALTWEDIDFTQCLIHINKTAARLRINGQWHYTLTAPKTETSKRIIPISKKIAKVLKQVKRDKKMYVVSTRTNTMVSIRAYQCYFQRLQKRLQILPLNFHALRHTFATRAIESGIDVKTLSEILGHSDASITLNRYVHSFMSVKRKAMERLSKMIDIDLEG